jgi:hypothetical protein
MQDGQGVMLDGWHVNNPRTSWGVLEPISAKDPPRES